MSNKFKGCYEVDDGYVGGFRPKFFSIREDDIEEEMTEEDLRELFQSEMQSAFDQSVFPFEKNEDAFVEWARATMQAAKE